MHADQLTVTVEVVRDLVDEQFPQWVDLPLRQIDSEGTVNAIFRLGDHLAVRLPLRATDIAALRQRQQREADACRQLSGRTRFATPEAVASGQPGPGFPLPWSVQTWVPGTTATWVDTAEMVDLARDLARFVADVRALDTQGRTFAGGGRGGDLTDHDEWMEYCFQRSERLLDVAGLRRMWRRLRELPRTAPDTMTHGDLVPGNVLVSDGRIAGVIDVGGLGPTDPALDLVGAWHLLDAQTRNAFRAELGCDDLEWERGKAWAFQQATGAVWYYINSNPAMFQMGRRTIARILADET